MAPRPSKRVCKEADMRVLIVDDHSLFCEGLALLLKSVGDVSLVRSCTRASQALELAKEQDWDLILLDWNLGSDNAPGAQLLAAIKTVRPETRVVVVSADTSRDRVHEAIEAGAVGFVPKEASADLLIDAIRITSHGGIYLPAHVLQTNRVSTEGPVPGPGAESAVLTLDQRYPRLTRRQVDVLVCAVQGQPNKRIARNLGISDGTVKQHLNAVFRELEVSNRTEAVYRLAQQGIKVF
jgi:two-component system, NarL family, nitrate/nitrite response regulator NarL